MLKTFWRFQVKKQVFDKPKNEHSHMKRYTYTGWRRFGIIYSQFFGFFGILLFNLVGFLLLIEGFFYISGGEKPGILNDPRLSAVCFSGVFILGSWFLGGMIINHLPDIWLGEEGITISYLILFRVFIPWANISNVINQEWWSYKYTLVLAKRITIFHNFSNWLFYHKPDPCFAIGYDIEDAQELISTIRSKALFHSKEYQTRLTF